MCPIKTRKAHCHVQSAFQRWPRLTLNEVMRCKPGSLLVLAPVCKSMSAMYLRAIIIMIFVLLAYLISIVYRGYVIIYCMAWNNIFSCVIFFSNSTKPRSRHTSGRTSLNPWGHTNYPFVEEGNTLACRVILLILVATWKNLHWLLEQPDGSFVPQLPRFQWLLKIMKAIFILTNVDLMHPIGKFPVIVWMQVQICSIIFLGLLETIEN